MTDQEIVTPVYECWVYGRKDSFVKKTDRADVILWLASIVQTLGKHESVHIVLHTSDEYES